MTRTLRWRAVFGICISGKWETMTKWPASAPKRWDCGSRTPKARTTKYGQPHFVVRAFGVLEPQSQRFGADAGHFVIVSHFPEIQIPKTARQRSVLVINEERVEGLVRHNAAEFFHDLARQRGRGNLQTHVSHAAVFHLLLV